MGRGIPAEEFAIVSSTIVEVNKFVRTMTARFGAKRLSMTEMFIDELFYGRVSGDIIALGVFNLGHRRFDVSPSVDAADVLVARFVFCLRTILSARSIAVSRTGDGLNVRLLFDLMPARPLDRLIILPTRDVGELVDKAESIAAERGRKHGIAWLREQISGAVLSALLEDVVALGW